MGQNIYWNHYQGASPAPNNDKGPLQVKCHVRAQWGGGLVEFCKVWLLVNSNQISYYTACYLAGYLIQLNANQGEWEKTNFIHTRFRLPELLGLSLTLPSSASTQLTSIQAEFSLLLTPIPPPSQELHNKDSIRPKSCYGSCVNRQT